MYNYPYYWQNMQQCNLITSQFYSFQSQNVNCMQRVNEACDQAICSATQNQQETKNGSIKTCRTCKNRDTGSFTLCGKLRTFNLAYECVFGGYPNWEPKIDIDVKYYDTKTSIATELSQCKTNEENLEVARKHGLAIDLTKQDNQPEKDLQTKIRIEELERRIVQLEYQNLQTNVFKPYCSSEKSEDTHDSEDEEQTKEALNNALSSVLNALAGKSNQSEERFTLYDLYDLVFPDDPIKAHFDAERKRIIEKYKKQEEVVEKISVPDMPKRHPEPIQTVTYDDSSDLFEVMGVVMGGIIVGFVLICFYCMIGV